MNPNHQDDAGLANQLRDWSAIEPPTPTRAPIRASGLKQRFQHQRASRQRTALGLALLLCSITAWFAYSRTAFDSNLAARPEVERDQVNQADERLAADPTARDTDLQLHLAALQEQDAQLRAQLGRLRARLDALIESEEHTAAVERFVAARRQHVREQVLDEWLAQNP